ncbi:extracellular solute-binding protein [Paenibacillus sp. LHD-117]|uniref:ABC transporter substrate-binding protein n=1 Tax=Paenibacillus sp. LHD-117 TaxID=3071412 RepID=UPI0027E105A7|nr:extracellular solute-binding protein [Paenibacillus sp. LHD-117]MDQ6419648.1 extracellular solute-binding protein [Paenibacillus sp. LHD-117]
MRKGKASKSMVAMLLIALVVGLLSGCSGGNKGNESNGQSNENASKSAGGGKEVKLRVATSFAGSDPWVSAWTEAIKSFETAHPGVKIVDESTPVNQEALRTKIKADAATGNLADVMFYFNGSETKMLSESGKIVSWEEELQKDPEWAKTFNAAILDKVKYEGTLYALPYIGFYEGLFWNKTLFDKYQLAAPTTYEAFMKAVEVFAQNDIVPFATSLSTPYIQEALVLSSVGPEGQKQAYDVSWAPSINLIKDLYEKNAFPKDVLTLDDDKAQALFSGEKAAMMFNGSWTAVGLAQNPGIQITPFPLVPGGKGDNMIVSGFGSGWYMKKNDDQAQYDAALAFIKYMTSPEIAGKFAAIGGTYAVQTADSGNTAELLKAGNAMVAQAKDFVMPIDSYVSRESYTDFLEGIAYVVTGKKTAEEILAQAKKLSERN